MKATFMYGAGDVRVETVPDPVIRHETDAIVRAVRASVIIWHVVVDGVLYARSVRGPEGKWYVGVMRNGTGTITWGGQTRDVAYTLDASHDDAIDDAYFAKYGRGSASRSITTDLAKQTTLRIDPS